MTNQIAHSIHYGNIITGHNDLRCRVFGQPDRDTAAMYFFNKYPNSYIRSVEAVDADSARQWGETDA